MSKLLKVPCRLHLSNTGELYVGNTGLGSEAVAYPKAVAKALEAVARAANMEVYGRGPRLGKALARLEKARKGES